MRALKRTGIEIAVLCGVAIVLGFGINSVRGRDSINLTRNYFPPASKPAASTSGPATAGNASQVADALPGNTHPGHSSGRTQPDVGSDSTQPGLRSDGSRPAALPIPAPPDDLADGTAPENLSDLEDTYSDATSEFQTITIEQTMQLFNHPNTAAGIYLFVDARGDQAYADGHIPGAIQCDHYRLGEFIDSVCKAAECAEKVIVYCEGGECEDSLLLCRELLMAEIPHDKLYLFPGGCEEWSAHDMPCEKGGNR